MVDLHFECRIDSTPLLQKSGPEEEEHGRLTALCAYAAWPGTMIIMRSSIPPLHKLCRNSVLENSEIQSLRVF